MMETSYQVCVSPRFSGRHKVRQTHARAVERVRIGSGYNGEPVFSTYPMDQALCTVNAVSLPGAGPVSAETVSCPACRSALRKLGQIPARTVRGS